jgi:hypothetical protein
MDGPNSASVFRLLRWMKEGPPGAIPITQGGRTLGCLTAVTWDDAGDLAVIDRLVSWHRPAFATLAGQFPVTPDGARQWLTRRVLADEGRALFWVRGVSGEPVGHVGLCGFDFHTGSVEACDVIAGEPAAAWLVNAAISALGQWATEALGVTPTSRALSAA